MNTTNKKLYLSRIGDIMMKKRSAFYIGTALIIASILFAIVIIFNSINWLIENYDSTIAPLYAGMSTSTALCLGLVGFGISFWVFVVNVSEKFNLPTILTIVLGVFASLLIWVCAQVVGNDGVFLNAGIYSLFFIALALSFTPIIISHTTSED